MGRFLGLGLVSLIRLFNPEKIVMGGKVSQAWDYFIGSVMETVQERTMEALRERLQIVQAECGDDAGMLGAAYSALTNSNDQIRNFKTLFRSLNHSVTNDLMT